MRSHIDDLMEDVSVVMSRADVPDRQIRHLVHRFMDHYVGAANRQKVLLNELDSLPDKRRTEIVAKQRSIIDAMSGLLAAHDAELARDPARLRVQAMLLFGMINWTHTWFNSKGSVSASEVAEMALNLIFRERMQPNDVRQAS